MIEKRFLSLLGVLALGFAVGFASSSAEFEKPKITIPTEFNCTHQRPDSKVNIKEVAHKVSGFFKGDEIQGSQK